MAAILKYWKRPYLCNALTDLHKIWHGDAFWPPKDCGQLKLRTFENPRWRTAAILKNFIYGHISGTAWPTCTKFGTVVLIGTAKAYLLLEFQTSENPLSFPLLPSLHPFPFPFLFSCSLTTHFSPSHSSTLPFLTLSSPPSSLPSFRSRTR